MFTGHTQPTHCDSLKSSLVFTTLLCRGSPLHTFSVGVHFYLYTREREVHERVCVGETLGRGGVPAANLLLCAVLAGEHQEGGLDDAAAEAEHQMQRRLCIWFDRGQQRHGVLRFAKGGPNTGQRCTLPGK